MPQRARTSAVHDPFATPTASPPPTPSADLPANDNRPDRTPAEHRAALAAWAETAPENDGEIFGRRAHSEKPRHARLAEDFRPLVEWRRLREAAEAGDCGTSWFATDEAQMADNDNVRPTTLFDTELTEDTADALLRRLGDYEFRDVDEAVLRRDATGQLVVAERRTRRVIVGHAEPCGFARYDATRFRTADRTRHVALGRVRQAGDAIFAGPGHKYPAGTLGYISRAGGFVPLDVEFRPRERSSNPPPVESPVSGQEAFEARDELAAVLPLLDERTVLVLETASRAENFEAVGNALGIRGDYARKAGMTALKLACAKFTTAQKELARKAAT